MSRYAVSSQARDDLKAIYRHIKTDSPSAAKRMHARFYDKFRSLAAHPYIGWVHPELPEELRCTTVGNFVIVYRPREKGVDIVHVVHGARDLEALLPPEE